MVTLTVHYSYVPMHHMHTPHPRSTPCCKKISIKVAEWVAGFTEHRIAMSASLCLVVLFIISLQGEIHVVGLYIISIFNFTGAIVKANYEWKCTEPVNGQRYIPSVRNTAMDAAESVGDNLYVIPVEGSELESGACYGAVFTVEYCYFCPSTAATFKWALYLLEEVQGGVIPEYLIKDSIPLESHFTGDTSACNNNLYCDKTEVRFQLRKGFVYGITADEGNTPGVNLAAYHDALQQYWVDSFRIPKDEDLNLEVGSTFSTRNPSIKRGLRMLWFAIGKFHYLGSTYFCSYRCCLVRSLHALLYLNW